MSAGAVELLARCRDLGIDLAAGPDDSLAWEADADPPAELLQALRENKLALLALLAPPTVPTVPAVPWDVAEAGRLVKAALAAWCWPVDPAARRRLGELADAVDAAYLARDLRQLRQAVAAFLAAVGAAEARVEAGGLARAAPSVAQPRP
jgi:hypothetical protein